ncbi:MULTISPECIES: leucyl/phenylalanyl-tRNA--protein transferase [Vibrio]|uniref:leucyl/phenylalanyl-tRNA--protein transferase n=1 Tax=Vibrio TaxID=662 RepID=UPI0001B958F2|nr:MULTISPECIES: leucyl/phenylalanyl-tRNA--protein transferase [Vibrio]EEX31668.1 leucyl/phenylalanyl-tRNA--protein transferase [Vibrio coralliilyticus ATCC BAA-450]MCM5506639.1 leucyl/phenylalanyl-tRNA--protein transferase [Vibrio sp. SCSIO 43169]MDE3898858.1 leucyl/phenylalanyl-tRNA--protein transferase [Vibrio sp. CC007]QFT37003.1 Leucyl/phenylalanyl-tRNA--protein transferase [Vibrio sp. THAF64]QGM34904.1 Leucyl/phenylalanyl-tRNA--protein transferase [Vibrio sp. THAF191d]
MAIYLTELDEDKLWFPSPYEALNDPNGLLAFGGDLSPDRLLLAYQNGIFPWYGPGEPLLWWSPSPRAVFDPKTFKPAKSLKKFQKKHQYQISINLATEAVIDHCASMRPEHETWLNEEMRASYKKLATLGHCHSVEVWKDEALIGGLYGLSIGQVFCGESMFSRETNASKVALWYFCEHFKSMKGQLIDCQVMNPHLKSLGAQELDRDDFMQSLLSLRQEKVVENSFKAQWLELSSGENQ